MDDPLMDATTRLAAELAGNHADLSDEAFSDLVARVGADFAEQQAGRLNEGYLKKVIERFTVAAWTARSGAGRRTLN